MTQSDQPVLTWLINFFANPCHRLNRRTKSEYNSLPTPYCPIPPLIVELQTTLRQRNLIPPRAFDTLQRSPNAEEGDSLNVDTSDPLNQSLMVDIDVARNLEDAFESLFEQNASN